MYFSYVYLVTNKITKQFYYGSRYKNIVNERSPEEDLWIHYFTSSKLVKSLIAEYGKDSFDFEIIHRNVDYDNCYWIEQEFIKEHIKNPLSLNKTYIDKIYGVKFSTAGSIASEETRKKISIAKSNLSKETRTKMSTAKKNKSTGPFTETRKDNISKSKTGKKNSEIHCQNISLSKTGTLNPNYGKPRDEATKEKMSLWNQEHKEEKSNHMRERWKDPIFRKMMMDARKKS